ncbi:MAG TPA: 3-hydroxyacyl-CoA dehydrogenase NAD-binding domain-containing protein [Longimicrobiales bacterium]|nr:3-hydroxyacyl-CoA dehydrogenase NAD-binding domain-containing protein [Longimicrobiales bacterium]
MILEHADQGVARLVFDRPDARVNILTQAVMERLDTLLGEIEEGARDGGIRSLVIRSGKAGTFIAGADVNEIAGVTDPEEGRRAAARGQAVFRRLEHLPVPSVAAIDGVCLGGGTELALACTYRIAADRDETQIGLPEVRLGILPGFGGTVRLPRLVGLRAALDMILTGKSVNARKAQRTGLVDERVPAAILYERAHELARDPAAIRERAGRRSKGLGARLLEDTAPGRRVVLAMARKQVLKETRGHYPAPLAILETVRRTLPLDIDRALAVEAEAVGRLVATPESKNLIHIFHLMEAAKKKAPSAPPREVERMAVLGAGVMGGGIAQLAAYRGITVRLKDIQSEALTTGLSHAHELFQKAVRRRRLSEGEASDAMARISPTLDYSGFGALDLVVEAVVERMDVKKTVLREAEEKLPDGAVLASNTSTLSITEMGRALQRPERLCGMHFFNPVHRMPLVEVIRGEDSSDEAVATVFAAARKLGKTPLIVRDGPGFLVNRVLGPYLNEAGWLLSEGASVADVDRALVDFGMPMGPFRLLDEVGWDVAGHAGAVLHEAFGERLEPAPVMAALGRTGRLGKKAGKGFYGYEKGRETGVDESVYADLGEAVPRNRREVSEEEIVDRCVLAMVNEAARILEDGIVAEPGDVDLGMITGTGFPPFRGGLLRWADTRGAGWVKERLEAFRAAHGARFAPAPLLKRLAEHDGRFYDAAPETH